MSYPVKVVIVEDHAILRAGLCAILNNARGIDVIGEARDGTEAIRAAAKLQPDLVLMDIFMPRVNGTESIRQIKQRCPQTKILMLTMHKAEEQIRVSMAAGADGYMLKDDSKEELLAAIRHVVNGHVYLSPAISGTLLGAYLRGNDARSSWERLTPRERQTLRLIADGKKTREIAALMSVSTKTVEKHRSNLMRKLDLHNAAALTSYAIQNHIVDAP